MMVLLIPSVTMVETNRGKKERKKPTEERKKPTGKKETDRGKKLIAAVQKLPNEFLEVVGDHSIWSVDHVMIRFVKMIQMKI